MKIAICPVVLVALLLPAAALAQQGPSEQELKQANNPLADMVALNVQNYYVSELYGLGDETANTAWLRFVMPVGRWLTRFSLPLPTVPVAGEADQQSGIGDLNGFAAYLLSEPGSPTAYGVGPLLVAPTASDEVLGADKWQAGAALVYFNAASAQLQYGGLVTYQRSFSGDGEHDVSTLVLQPFSMWQLGKGTYLRAAPLWVFDLENDAYAVPIGAGIGKITKVGSTVFNVFIEPQWTVLHEGVGQPAFQLFFGLNMQFVGGGK